MAFMASRLGRMAPVGAAVSATTASLFLGEHATSKATNRVASKSMDSATRLLLQCHQQRRTFTSKAIKKAVTEQQRRAFTTEATKKVVSEPAKRNIAEAAAAAPAETAKANNVVPRQSFLQWYEHHLHERPVATKMVTGSILWSLGDAVAQIVPYMASKDPNKPEFTYDWPRTGRAAFFGFAIHAPASHLHFNFLEWMTVKGGFQGLTIPVFKTIMEQFVYWSWISNSMYHGCMSLMQGASVTQAVEKIEDVLWDTQKAQWAFWIPIQLLNFKFIPVRHQLNVVLLTSIVWTALLSAWYPPEPQETGESDSQPKTDGTESAKAEAA